MGHIWRNEDQPFLHGCEELLGLGTYVPWVAQGRFQVNRGYVEHLNRLGSGLGIDPRAR